MADVVEPGAVIESGALDHQRVAVPVAYRIAHPVGIRVARERAPVEEDLAVGEIVGEHHNQRRGLNDFARASTGAGAEGEAENAHVVFEEVFFTLLRERIGPGLRLDGFDGLLGFAFAALIFAPQAG